MPRQPSHPPAEYADLDDFLWCEYSNRPDWHEPFFFDPHIPICNTTSSLRSAAANSKTDEGAVASIEQRRVERRDDPSQILDEQRRL